MIPTSSLKSRGTMHVRFHSSCSVCIRFDTVLCGVVLDCVVFTLPVSYLFFFLFRKWLSSAPCLLAGTRLFRNFFPLHFLSKKVLLGKYLGLTRNFGSTAYLQSQAQPNRIVSLSHSASDLLSSGPGSCPSLSPSPSYPRSVVSEDFDFCDPRNLTVGTANSTLGAEYAALPTLCAGRRGRQIFFRGEVPTAATVPHSPPFTFSTSAPHGLPTFEELSDLESDDDFVNGLVELGDHTLASAPRSRASSDAVSLGHESFYCEDEPEGLDGDEAFPLDSLPSPPCSDNDCHQDKRQKIVPRMNSAAESQADSADQQSNRDGSTSSTADKSSSSPSASLEDATPNHQPAPQKPSRAQAVPDRGPLQDVRV